MPDTSKGIAKNKSKPKQSRRLPAGNEHYELAYATACIRFSQFLFHEGRAAKANYPYLDELELDPESPIQISSISSLKHYSKYVTGEVSQEYLSWLKAFIKAEIANNTWGRMLFYLIQGDKEFNVNGRTVRLSTLPKLFYPKHCASPICNREIKAAQLKKRGYLCGSGECNTNTRSWKDTRKKIKWMFDLVYDREPLRNEAYNQFIDLNIDDLPRAKDRLQKDNNPSLQQAFDIIWKGYIELVRYINKQEYVPTALTPEQFKDCSGELIKRLFKLPHELYDEALSIIAGGQSSLYKEVISLGDYSISHSGYPNWIVTFGEFDQCFNNGHGPMLLPVSCFNKQKLKRQNTFWDGHINRTLNAFADKQCRLYEYKIVTCFKNARSEPVGWQIKTNPTWVFLLLCANKFLGFSQCLNFYRYFIEANDDVENFICVEDLDDLLLS